MKSQAAANKNDMHLIIYQKKKQYIIYYDIQIYNIKNAFSNILKILKDKHI